MCVYVVFVYGSLILFTRKVLCAYTVYYEYVWRLICLRYPLWWRPAHRHLQDRTGWICWRAQRGVGCAEKFVFENFFLNNSCLNSNNVTQYYLRTCPALVAAVGDIIVFSAERANSLLLGSSLLLPPSGTTRRTKPLSSNAAKLSIMVTSWKDCDTDWRSKHTPLINPYFQYFRLPELPLFSMW